MDVQTIISTVFGYIRYRNRHIQLVRISSQKWIKRGVKVRRVIIMYGKHCI